MVTVTAENFIKTCQECGEKFECTTAFQRRVKICCSEECARARQVGRNRKQRQNKSEAKHPDTKICVSCGEKFYRNGARMCNWSPKQYCSKRCRDRYRTHDGPSPQLIEKPCGWCGDLFMPRSTLSTYCCYDCQRLCNQKRRQERIKSGCVVSRSSRIKSDPPVFVSTDALPGSKEKMRILQERVAAIDWDGGDTQPIFHDDDNTLRVTYGFTWKLCEEFQDD